MQQTLQNITAQASAIAPRAIGAMLVSFAGWFLGVTDGLLADGLLTTLLFFMAVDYCTGVACGVRNKNLSSEIGFKGIIKKVLIFVLVGVSHQLDANVLSTEGLLRNATILYYLSNEGISLLENICRLGVPVHPKLKAILKQIQNGAGKELE